MVDEISSKEIPWQVSAIFKMGVPSAIAIYLVWNLVAGFNSAIDSMNTSLAAHTIDSSNFDKEQTQILNDVRRAIMANCLNGAVDTSERNKCLGWEALVP